MEKFVRLDVLVLAGFYIENASEIKGIFGLEGKVILGWLKEGTLGIRDRG